ncbi:DUF4282 domain-containing protein [Ideonella sp.]|uniref:DUF4282 domain-containing protein n=1 Tax=Ideonella sp. TaxID=1929293 RepID=UPI0035B27DC5
MRSLLFFDSMITPRIITALYWLMLAASAAAGAATMLSLGPLSFPGIAAGLVVMAGGALGARVGSELLIVLFKINENMAAVSQRL